MATAYALSTRDNPVNPFEDYQAWLDIDIQRGHDCPGRLARFARTSSNMTDVEYNKEISRAIDEIIRLDILDEGFMKVSYEED